MPSENEDDEPPCPEPKVETFRTIGEALEAAYPWGYQSEDNEP